MSKKHFLTIKEEALCGQANPTCIDNWQFVTCRRCLKRKEIEDDGK